MLLKFNKKNGSKVILFVMLALSLAGCISTDVQQEQMQVNYNTNDGYAICKADAQAMDRSAQQAASKAQYLSSARALRNCIVDALGQRVGDSSQQDIMQMIALSTLNYIKGGNVFSAQEMVVLFKKEFPGKDLYFTDYTSFLDTITALIGSDEISTFELSSLNISRELRGEVERKNYWLTN